MSASGPLRATQERAGQALAVAHAALMQARLHCKLQEQCGTTSASPRLGWSLLPDRFLSPGNGYPAPALLGSLALWPFPRRVPPCPLPSQPMMKPDLEYGRTRRLED